MGAANLGNHDSTPTRPHSELTPSGTASHRDWRDHVASCNLCRLLEELMDELEAKRRQFALRRP